MPDGYDVDDGVRTGWCPDASMMDIQQAIWYFTDAGHPMPTDPEAKAMVDDALIGYGNPSFIAALAGK